MKKNILLLLVLCVSSLQIFADSTYSIYCLVQNPATKQLHLGMIEPENGGVYMISTSSFPAATLNNNTIDPYNKIYYFTIGGTLVGMDITNGEIHSQVNINLGQGQHFVDFEFNTTDSTIYGLVSLDNHKGFRLSKINSETGEIEFISDTTTFLTITNKSHTLDSDKGIYYTRSNNTLIGVNIKTGKIVSNAMLKGEAEDFNFIKYNKNNGKIYGLSRPAGPGKPFYLATIDPETGEISLISPNMISSVVSVGGSTFDYSKNRFHFSSYYFFLGIDIDSGVISSSVLSYKINMHGYNSLDYKYTGEKTRIFTQGNEGGGGNLSHSLIQTDKLSWNVYPNPASNFIRIETNQLGVYEVQLYSSIGARIANVDFSQSNELDIDVGSCPEGIYYLYISQNGHVVSKEKVLIVR